MYFISAVSSTVSKATGEGDGESAIASASEHTYRDIDLRKVATPDEVRAIYLNIARYTGRAAENERASRCTSRVFDMIDMNARRTVCNRRADDLHRGRR